MFEQILKRMREKIRVSEYVMTTHAEEEMSEDELTIFDVERVILIGEIVERQRDHQTEEWKYMIRGQTIAGEDVVVAAKLSVTGVVVVITVYLI